jgi:hypothetical protein
MLRSVSVSRTRSRRPGPLAAGLLLLLALAGAPPAHATSGTIDSPWTGSVPIRVFSGETLTITANGSVSASGRDAIQVIGGTVNVSGGSVSASGSGNAILAGFGSGGTVIISGGSISATSGSLNGAVSIAGGTARISGGSIDGTVFAQQGATIDITGGTINGSVTAGFQGTINVYGCNLALSGGMLTGTLEDSTAISAPASTGLAGRIVLHSGPTFSNCPPAGTTAIATCTAGGVGANVSFGALLATAPCGGTPTVSYDHQPGSFFPLGNTTVNATAMDASGNSTTCPFTVTVAYAWSGVQQPINADGSSVFKAGSTVPVMFQLSGDSACITNLPATLSYSLASLGESAPVNEADSPSAATTGNQFRYAGGQYVFNWSTKGLGAGKYLLRIDLGDGVPHTVIVGLR